MKKYAFKKYNKKFIQYFNYEKKILQEMLSKFNPKIYHIGSTAVKGLGGKGIVDLLVLIKKGRMNDIVKILKRKYKISKSGGSKERVFLFRDIKYNNKRRVHVHVCPKKSEEAKRTLKFLKILKKDKDIRKKYEEIKKEAVKKAKGEGKIYRKIKDKFIKKVLSKEY